MSKQKSTILNMTEGDSLSLLIRFSIPMLIGNLFQQLYNLVDCRYRVGIKWTYGLDAVL